VRRGKGDTGWSGWGRGWGEGNEDWETGVGEERKEGGGGIAAKR